MTLANDVAGPSGVVNLTSADVKLDTEGRDCSFKGLKYAHIFSFPKQVGLVFVTSRLTDLM